MGKGRHIYLFLAIAFAWSWISWSIAINKVSSGLNETTVRPFLTFLFLGIWGPTVSALLTTWICSGFQEVLELLKKFLIWKVPGYLYLFILLVPLLATGISVGLFSVFETKAPRFDLYGIKMAPIYILAALKGGPLGEEPGWRGFLLPAFQQKYPAVKSSLIVGVIWFSWHIPLFWAPIGTAVSGAPVSVLSVVTFFVFVTSLSCIYTWLVNSAKGSLLIAVLIHLSINAGLAMLFFPDIIDPEKKVYYISALVYLIVAIIIWLRTGLKSQVTS